METVLQGLSVHAKEMSSRRPYGTPRFIYAAFPTLKRGASKRRASGALFAKTSDSISLRVRTSFHGSFERRSGVASDLLSRSLQTVSLLATANLRWMP
jgi:hypothetical protein